MRSQTISFAALGGAPAFTEAQTYPSYDALNRLVTAQTALWTETNGYDAFGNRWVLPSRSGLPALTQLTPQASGWFDAQNRIVGWGYDAAGNLASHLSRTFTYDAENRQVSALVNEVSATYAYDGEGRRVKSVTPSGTTTYVYDAGRQTTVGPVSAVASANAAFSGAATAVAGSFTDAGDQVVGQVRRP